ncbi:2-amino-4-hydroxy-6-hydroxymethyldihydropteridine diphosphokinase [Vreelandella zhaodongensis]|uniref:2-amino-4-hydroxy-6- hydroxymethyldihydropteridine diphosphokinase n=1 Tax=Vreelandella zhaodongensis TaxID=1176240 RepID=UPI003EB7926C
MQHMLLQTTPGAAHHECLISLGTNIEPEHHFVEALTILRSECELIASSEAIRTAPVGFQHQPDFLNAALLVRTPLAYDAFRAYLKDVENRLGRVRGPIKSGPRTMDLDIVAWDGEVIDEGYYQHSYVRRPVDEVLTVSCRTLKQREHS